ncbi:DNA polymerase III subunit alpha [Patescibacteria group bacterium]|nr:DNA polymerase III subunit alpha [Patescibacteria group bacterium]MCG2694904.1 DNA polymerase III subunit alpha [Candidatus Parcubacteria bacterium]
MNKKFTHLHTHSHYSLLTALPKIPDLIKTAKENEMEALALTDDGNMYATIEFYKACRKAKIKPILGVDFYVSARTRHDKQHGIDNRRSRLVMLAKNEIGYKNLIKLASISNLEGFYYKPRIDRELIEKYKDGLICISPHFSGEISQSLKVNSFEKAEETANWYKNIFGDNLYLEITHHPEIEGQIELKEKIIQFGKRMNIPLVATHDVYYLKKEDKRARDILMSVQKSGGGAFGGEHDDFSFITPKQANEYFKNTPEALDNVQKIVDMCNVEIDTNSWYFPDIEIPKGETYDSQLRKVTYEGLKKRGLEKTKEIEDRIEYELEIIKNKGYSSYFLIVSDMINHARSVGIYTNTRGSAAGSLVSYLNFITKVNPIELKLPFERFMNPGRPGIPDIDVDIADIRRDDVIDYLREKYGNKAVAQIGTFGTMAARGSVRDVTRALGHPYALGDQIAKLIPMGSQGFPMTIDRALEMEEDLKKLHKGNKDVQEIIKYAKKIEGCARHISTHAAGVLISPTTIDDYSPVQLDKEGKIITQYDMYTGDRDGVVNLPKFDILGIKNLSILANAIDLAKKRKSAEVDLDNIDLNDKKTYEMLARGETLGTFQLNGHGMTQYLKELQPKNIWDIMAMVALYRPGPMAFIPDYIKRKRNPELVTYLHPELKNILEPTYGIIIYQDDVMLIAVNLAGYTWAEADKFRKAMGKKIPEMMQQQKEKFFLGCTEHGVGEKIIKELWETIETFAAYGFNKAHSASYGRVAYETSYMKANFPIEYMTALLMADSGDTEKVAEIISECKRINIPVLSPDINESFTDFTIVNYEEDGKKKEAIRFGLQTIKNFGEGIANIIIEERNKNGKFKSLADFLERIQDRNLNKKSLEALTKCGAMDKLGERGQILENMTDLLNYNKECAQKPEAQDSLFGLIENNNLSQLKLKEVAPAKKEDMLAWEKELLGLYISGHPLDKFKIILSKAGKNINDTREKGLEGATTVIAGLIEEIKPVTTKKGAKMAFIRLTDFSGSIESVAFPKVFEEYKNELIEDRCVMLKGKISKRNGEVSILIDAVKKLE